MAEQKEISLKARLINPLNPKLNAPGLIPWGIFNLQNLLFMNLFNKNAVAFGLMLLLNSPAVAQVSDYSSSFKTIPAMAFETVEGNKVEFAEMNKDAYILVLLPKPESKSEGQKMMKHVRSWMQEIRLMEENIFTLLVVEPFKTSFPFFGIQKRKLTTESYPVVINKSGEILNQFKASQGSPILVIADKNMNIADRSIAYPDSLQMGMKMSLIKELSAESQ